MRRELLGVVCAALGAGCQQDLVLAMGDLTGILVAPATDAVVLASDPPPSMVAEPMPTPDAPSDPQTAGVGGAPIDGADAAQDPAPAAQDGAFNPVSTPQGPRENEGVRWDGVKEKGGRSQTVRGAGHDVEFKRR